MGRKLTVVQKELKRQAEMLDYDIKQCGLEIEIIASRRSTLTQMRDRLLAESRRIEAERS